MWIKNGMHFLFSFFNCDGWSFHHTWLTCKCKFEIFHVECKNDKRASQNFKNRSKCQYFDKMDLWNYIWENMTNQMPTLIMEGNDNRGNQESIQFSHVNFVPPNGTKQRVKKNSRLIWKVSRKNGKEFYKLKILSFQKTTTLLNTWM